MGELFAAIRDALKRQGYLKEMFTFVDASHLISKLATWEERDKAIEKGIEKLNNETIQKVASRHAMVAKEKVNSGMAISGMFLWIVKAG